MRRRRVLGERRTESEKGRPRQGDPSRAFSPVWALTALMVAVTGAIHALFVANVGAPSAPQHVPWWALAAMFAAAEIFVIHLEAKRDAYSISLSEIPLVLGLVFAAPGALIMGRVVGAASALLVHRRQGGVKLVFNLALFYLETCVAVLVYRALVGERGVIEPQAWAGAIIAALVLHLLSAVTVTAAISLHERRLQSDLLRRAIFTGLLNAVTNTSLALVAAMLLWHDARAAALLVFVVVIIFLLSRAYSSLSQRYSSLQSLYAFTRTVNRSLQVEAVIEALLTQARELLKGESAEINLAPQEPGAAPMRWILSGDGPIAQAEPDPSVSALGERVIAEGRALLLSRSDDFMGDHLAALQMRDVMVAPVLADGRTVGTMLVANRMGAVTNSFDVEDLKLFETLVNHASVTLENGQLVERLRREAAEKAHQALHDALTGLPNRTLFRTKVEEAIAASWGSSSHVAVMLMDLDGFKEVNDTLGHHNGDLLLQEVSVRLSGLLREEDVIARLGGDEFAILLPGVADGAEAVKAAEKVLGALEEPFVHRELTLEVGASIGIALYPYHGAEASTLLQRADVAMYDAKAAQCGYEIYAPERDQYSPRRLALVGELRSSLENEELEVHYQPKASLSTGKIVGVEALVRWNHPRHGYLPPDEFIPVAEHTGLMRPLTLYVLRSAARQLRDWRVRGIELEMAVNLSARSLLDVHLPDDVAAILGEYDVPASCLTLEITESSIMADSPRTIGVMTRLSMMGVELAIDDFGTGYSSLSYLKRLPVDEVKIDRSFVMNMAVSDNDGKIVRSTINLAHDLGLRVVAEGVENQETWDRLSALGCDIAQGYFLSRPVPAARLEQWFLEAQPWMRQDVATVVPIARASQS